MIDREKPIYVQVEQWLEACYNPDNTMSTPEKLTHAYRLLSHFKNQNDAKVPVETTMNDKVKLSEIVEALRHVGCASGLDVRHALANRIEAHGIEQPSIDALIAEAVSDQPPFMRGKYRKQFEASVKEAIEEKPVSEANDLIKRIDDALKQFGISTYEWDLLADCRAEIELLTQSNQCLRGQNESLDDECASPESMHEQVGCDEIPRQAPSFDAQREGLLLSYIDECIMLRAALVRAQRKYVPMTVEERENVRAMWLHNGYNTDDLIKFAEATVIKRAGLEVKHD